MRATAGTAVATTRKCQKNLDTGGGLGKAFNRTFVRLKEKVELVDLRRHPTDSISVHTYENQIGETS